MKKFVGILTAAAVTLLAGVSAAAAVPSYTAAYGTPTVDGVVNSSEYGPAVPFNKSNLSLFYYLSATEDSTGANANFPDCTYSFAWNENGLYVGIVAKNIENIIDARFQIDLNPEKKIKDGKKGIFYTFKVIELGENGMVSVVRDNYQTGGSTRPNITNKDGVKAVAKESGSGVYHLEAVIPLAELRVTGTGGNFTALNLKAGTWGLGCYMVGNGGGYTSTQGATEPRYQEGLVEYYNTFTLQAKQNSGSAGGTGSDTGKVSSTGSSQSAAQTGSRPGSSTTSSAGGNAQQPGSTESGADASAVTSAQAGETESAGTEGTGSQNTAGGEGDREESSLSAGGEQTDNSAGSGSEAAGENNAWLVWLIVLGGIVVLCGAGSVVYIVLKKKGIIDSSGKERSDDNGKK